MAKLFLHRMPKNVPTEELHKIIPGDFTIELKVEYILLLSDLFFTRYWLSLWLPEWCLCFTCHDIWSHHMIDRDTYPVPKKEKSFKIYFDTRSQKYIWNSKPLNHATGAVDWRFRFRSVDHVDTNYIAIPNLTPLLYGFKSWVMLISKSALIYIQAWIQPSQFYILYVFKLAINWSINWDKLVLIIKISMVIFFIFD